MRHTQLCPHGTSCVTAYEYANGVGCTPSIVPALVLALGKGASSTTMHVDTSSMMLSAVKLTCFEGSRNFDYFLSAE